MRKGETSGLSALLLPNEILAMPAQSARRLVESGDGDAALLYLALLDRGTGPDGARTRLHWSQDRLERAWQRLAALGLVEQKHPPAPPTPAPEEKPPEYSRKDLADALEREPDFQNLYQEVERIVSRPLTDNDLKCLYTIYDHLALPSEVILLLTGYTARRLRRQGNGSSLRLRVPQIQKEAFRWKRLGVDTVERAEEYLRRQELVDRREWKILSIIGASTPRAAVEKEREYIEQWVEMGMSDELIALAYERTVYQKKEMNWPYMNRILQSWHQAGYTTAQQVRTEDRPPQRRRSGRKQAGPESFQPSQERIRKNADWLDEFLKEQEKGG